MQMFIPLIDIFSYRNDHCGRTGLLSLTHERGGGYAFQVLPLGKQCKSGRSCEQQAHQIVED